MSQSHAPRPLRVAIVGLGPKGLYALERLLHHSRPLPDRSIAVTIYEPHSAPGAGPVYDPSQPTYLRMNFAADLVNMWPPGGGPAFSAWRRTVPEIDEDPYPPRADVGRYLSEGFDRLIRTAPAAVDITVLKERASAITRDADGWVVSAGEPHQHDEVVVATGHESSWSGALERLQPDSEATKVRVFPVERELSIERVPAGSLVAIRGFALTMIDAVLALTEGRGGTFSVGSEPFLSRYEPGGLEPAAIHPWSRTNRPMLAKPEPSRAIRSPELDDAAKRGRSDLEALRGEVELGEVIRILAGTAAESLLAAAPDGAPCPRALSDALEGVSRGVALSFGVPAAEEISQSIAVAAGAAEPGPAWALGHTWRALYPALVERLGAGGLPAGEWPGFRMLAREMERIAFGPPPVNAAKLLALVEAGVAKLSDSAVGPPPGTEVIVDAVLPPPGAADIRQPLLEGMIRDGHARVASNRRGIEITSDVECVDAHGSPSLGLGVIGRPTEDWVIGNDTLNRTLHPQPDRWALRVVDRASP